MRGRAALPTLRTSSHPAQLAAIFAALLLLARAAGAQGADSAGAADAAPDASRATFELAAIPEVPALVYLGVAPSRVARPTTARDLALSLAQGVDAAGRVRQGFAVDVQPWFALRAPLSRERYQRSRLWYALANVQAGLGLARSAGGDSAATDAVLGVKTTLVDRADENADARVDQRLQAVERECVGLAKGDARRFLTCVRPRARGVLDSVYRANWNGFALSASAVLGGRLARSELGAMRYAGAAAWLTAALPLGRRGQLLAQGRVDDVRPAPGESAAAGDASPPGTGAAAGTSAALGADAADGSAASRRSTALSAGMRALVGSARANGFAEVVARRWSAGAARSAALWSAGVEVRAAEKLWLSTGLGSAFRTRYARDRVVVILNVRWNISDGPRIAPCTGCAGG